MRVNKATVNTAKETKINNEIKNKSRNEFCFKKKKPHKEKKGIIVFCEIFCQ